MSNKLLAKGISKDCTYIVLDFQCKNGVDKYRRRFLIKNKVDIFTGYGCCIRTPDFTINIKGVEYSVFWVDGKTIKIPRDDRFEYDGVCYISKEVK